MCSINRPEFPCGREEVFVVWVLVMGFPDALRRRRRSWQGLWAAVVIPMVAHRGWAGEFGKHPIGCKTFGNSHTLKGHQSWGFHSGTGFETSTSERVGMVWKGEKHERKEIFILNMRTHFPCGWSSLNEMRADLSLKAELYRDVEGNSATQRQQLKIWWTEWCRSFSPCFCLVWFEIASHANKMRAETGW